MIISYIWSPLLVVHVIDINHFSTMHKNDHCTTTKLKVMSCQPLIALIKKNEELSQLAQLESLEKIQQKVEN